MEAFVPDLAGDFPLRSAIVQASASDRAPEPAHPMRIILLPEPTPLDGPSRSERAAARPAAPTDRAGAPAVVLDVPDALESASDRLSDTEWSALMSLS